LVAFKVKKATGGKLGYFGKVVCVHLRSKGNRWETAAITKNWGQKGNRLETGFHCLWLQIG